MDLEEAKANIGKEVVYIGNDRELIDNVFKDKKLIICEPTKRRALVVLIEYDELCFWSVPPQDLKLKDKPMQNYKIKVTPETSAEVQELFFELGYIWTNGHKEVYTTIDMKLIFVDEDGMFFSEYNKFTTIGDFQEITLPQLRDMVVLKKNDVNDATHNNVRTSTPYLKHGDKEYFMSNGEWVLSNCPNELKPIIKETQMTWQDALRAVADGKDLEMINIYDKWESIGKFPLCRIATDGNKFRLSPQRKELNGKFTKEELLKIVGEMG